MKRNSFIESQPINHQTLTGLLNVAKGYIPEDHITIEFGKRSAVAMVDNKNNIGFEVFENEIIIYYFTDHCHFEDYSFSRENNEPDYIARAGTFLDMLFTHTIAEEKIYKGNRLIEETYSFISPDGITEGPSSVIYTGFGSFPLGKKHLKRDLWRFNREKQRFELTPDVI